MITAGNWPVNRGLSSDSTAAWNEREAPHFQTALDRMRALGSRYLMPEGRREYSGNVVTFKPIGTSPLEASGQLNYVFATENFADRVSVCALNDPDNWGPSDLSRLVFGHA